MTKEHWKFIFVMDASSAVDCNYWDLFRFLHDSILRNKDYIKLENFKVWYIKSTSIKINQSNLMQNTEINLILNWSFKLKFKRVKCQKVVK